MANAYGVIDPGKEWSPGQEKVDLFLNTIDGCPDGDDLEKLIGMGEAAAKAYIEEKFAELKAEVEAYFAAITAKIEAKLKPLKPLVPSGPPTDLGAVIEYIEALIAYFSEPYTGLIEMVAFYSTFSAAAMTAISAKLAKMPTSIPPVSDLPSVPGV